MSEWPTKSLAEIVQFRNGKAIRGEPSGSHPVYGSNGIIGSSDEWLYENSIILGRVGAYCGSVEFCPGRYWASDNTIVVEAIPSVIEVRFLYNLLKFLDLNRYAGGSAQPLLTQTVLKKIEVDVPPIEVQQRIASILSAYDDLIEVNQRRIAILEDMARRLFDEWFVRFRYPGHDSTPMVETELGPAPQGWDIKSLSDFIETQYGYTTSASSSERGPRFLRGMDINKNTYIDWASVPYCEEPPLDERRFALKRNDILVIRMADPGKVAIFESDVDAIFASYLVRLSANYDVVTPYFLFYTLCSHRYQNYVLGTANGATRKSIPASLMVSFPLVLPPREILLAFEAIVEPLRGQIQVLVGSNARLRAARNLLLPKLISGEIDLTQASENLAEAAE